MLHDMTSLEPDGDADLPQAAAVAALAAPRSSAAPAEPRARYGDRNPMSPAALTGVILLHVAVFLGAAYLGPTFTRHKEHRLRVVDIRLEKPPEPPKPVETPKTEVVKPLMQQVVPQPAPVLAAAVIALPDVQPAPPPVVAPAPAPPAPPAPPPTVQGGNLGAQMMSGKPPRYPIESRKKREQGTVVLALVVGVDGRVQNISIARSSGFSRLDDAARDAVKSWRWAPQMRDGQPALVRGVVEIPFVLQG